MTPLEIENLRVEFGKILKRHQLEPKKIKRENSCIAFSDEGEFQCESGHHGWTWRSRFSWLTFDLIKLEIVYRWKMKCKHCFVPASPTFKIEQLRIMFETVVLYYKGELEKPPINIGYSGQRNYRQPHLPELCEKCGYGRGNICWYRKFHPIPRKDTENKASLDVTPVVRDGETFE